MLARVAGVIQEQGKLPVDAEDLYRLIHVDRVLIGHCLSEEGFEQLLLLEYAASDAMLVAAIKGKP